MVNTKLTLRNTASPYADIVKGQVLSWAELDNNFITLKGFDITSGVLVGSTLTLNKRNGEQVMITGFGGGASGNTAYSSTDNYTSGLTKTITHNLGTTSIIVQLIDTNANEFITGYLNNYQNNSVDVLLSDTLPDVKIVVVSYGGTGSTLNTYVSGGTYLGGTATFTNTTGGTFNVTGFTGSTSIIIEGDGVDSSMRDNLNNTASGRYSTVFGSGNTATATYSSVLGGGLNNAAGGGATIGGGYGNVVEETVAVTATTNASTIGGGLNNVVSTTCSVIAGGSGNCVTASAYHSAIGGGGGNHACGQYTTISGGYQNQITSASTCSGILGGRSNVISANTATFIVGDNIDSDRNCTTFVNNLSIMDIPTSSAGLPQGAVWSDGDVLTIVP